MIGCDSKIFSNILTIRLDKVSASLIHCDQVGFVHTRSSVDNIRCLIGIMWASQKQACPAAAFSLGAKKVFDRVEWPYLFSTPETFCFSGKFISWIRLLYANSRASAATNGITSQPFVIHRGTRQGSFALCVSTVASGSGYS